jgi:UPF0042 nucleotide-binding protein
MEHLEIKLVTGLSGSGKSTALRALEDAGYFCIDNLPAALMVPFADLCDERRDIQRVALGVDVRSKEFFEGVEQALVEFDRRLYRTEVIFLDATDEVLMRRFSETRRPHPLASFGDVLTGISEERRVTAPLRERADRVLDTSRLDVHQLRRHVIERVAVELGGRRKPMHLRLQSFGYKYGIPIDSDLVIDVRFLPNPHFDDELRPFTGEDEAVYDYVVASADGEAFLDALVGFVEPLIPLYEREGKTVLTVSVGCTGGRHRSVAMVRALARRFSDHAPDVHHRDVGR